MDHNSRQDKATTAAMLMILWLALGTVSLQYQDKYMTHCSPADTKCCQTYVVAYKYKCSKILLFTVVFRFSIIRYCCTSGPNPVTLYLLHYSPDIT